MAVRRKAMALNGDVGQRQGDVMTGAATAMKSNAPKGGAKAK